MTGRSGNVLGYNALRQLITWQNQATSPTQTASYAYNGSGERVQQSVTSGGATTTTSYIGAYEDVTTTGGTTTTTKYYQMGKVGTAEAVNGALYYQIADDLGSVSATLTASGGVQATELYDPFGYVRYTNGTMPTSYGFTKMRQDPSGLNYDHARYYDAGVGQFVTADYVQGPNRYAYVGGNPETITDPSGNCWIVCAVIAAVVTTAAVAIVQQVTTGKVNWGQAVTAGAVVGLTVAIGPLATAAVSSLTAGAGAAGAAGAVASAIGTGLAGDAVIASTVATGTSALLAGQLSLAGTSLATTASLIVNGLGAAAVGASWKWGYGAFYGGLNAGADIVSGWHNGHIDWGKVEADGIQSFITGGVTSNPVGIGTAIATTVISSGQQVLTPSNSSGASHPTPTISPSRPTPSAYYHPYYGRSTFAF